MKKSNRLNLLFGAALAITLIALAGCASKNYQKGSDTGSGLIDAANRITAGKTKIDAVLAPLNTLVSNPQGDLVGEFNKFNDAVSDLQSSAQDVKSRVAAMRANGNEYFQNWDQQLATIKNEDIKSQSADRKAAVQKQFMDIKRSYTAVQMAFEPFMSDLKDIQAALGTDLTTGGVTAISGSAQKTNQDANALKASMDQLASQFNQLGIAMSATAPPAQPAATQ